MPIKASMRSNLSEGQPGGHRVESTRCQPGSGQLPFSWQREEQEAAARARIRDRQDALTALFEAAIFAYQKSLDSQGIAQDALKRLVSLLDRPPSYENKIRDAIKGRDDRTVQLSWLAPLLDDPMAGEVIAAWFNRETGFAPPIRERTLSEEETAETAFEVMSEWPESMKKGIREAVAKRRGVRPEDVKL